MTGKYELLLIEGECEQEELLEQWELIVKENSKASGDRKYESYFQLSKSYAQLVATYLIVKSSLLHLIILPADMELVNDLRKRGYKIDSEHYMQSIEACLIKVDNLVTRARMKQKEIESQFITSDRTKPGSFEEIMANLSVGLGFIVPDTLTLASYNEYKKILKAKARASRNTKR